MALRASGHCLRTLILQFVKSDDRTGELKGCANLPGVEIRQVGLGFLPPRHNPQFDRHRKTAEKGMRKADEAIRSGEYRLVILDEICFAVAEGLIAEDTVIEAVRSAPAKTCVVLTGRSASAGLLDLADTVTEMRLCKHAFENGLPSQPGVEY